MRPTPRRDTYPPPDIRRPGRRECMAARLLRLRQRVRHSDMGSSTFRGACGLLGQTWMGFRLAAVLGLLVPLIAWSSPAYAQCGGTQLCAPGPGDCRVDASCTITAPAGGLIALGARRLVITKTLTVQGVDPLTITAGEVLIDGGSIVAPGAGGIGGSVTIDSATSFVVQNDGLADVSAGISGGVIDFEALNGELTFSGRVKANATTRDGDGGTVSLIGSGNTSVGGGMIDVSGGDRASGGFLDIE